MDKLNAPEECKPLKSLKDVTRWSADESDWSTKVNELLSRSSYCYEGNRIKCHKKLHNAKKILNASAPKTLVCHDMKGGYLDDRFVHGSSYNYQYLFYHWSVIDVFVYFSHHFVTIPPLMWINAAHKHGVKILGTVITEHTDGEMIWDEILSNKDVRNIFVDRLVQICKHYRFDGYLINIENEIKSQLMENLSVFLADLKLKIRDYGILIWYDAVSFKTGKLDWQNELNEHNKTAFEICDGIFLNYAWKDSNLENSALNAGARVHDVYVGIDVFGRGCFGGGGFNTDVALSATRNYNLSAAIFGFGWTHETLSSDFNFFTVERKFWSKLLPLLFVHAPNHIPFKTSFNRGIGIHPSHQIMWYDLSTQSFQLSFPSCSDTETEKCCIEQFFDEGIFNNGCVSLNSVEGVEIHRLILCEFSCREKSPLNLTISVKLTNPEVSFKLELIVENEMKNLTVILNVSKNKDKVVDEKIDYSCCSNLNENINSKKDVIVSDDGWVSNKFFLEFDGVITEINAKVHEPVTIGYLSVE